MSSLSIVEDFDILKDGMQGILMTFISLMINQLGFHNTKKRLSYRIITAVPLAGHALDKFIFVESFNKKERTMKRSESIPPVIYDLKDDLNKGKLTRREFIRLACMTGTIYWGPIFGS